MAATNSTATLKPAAAPSARDAVQEKLDAVVSAVSGARAVVWELAGESVESPADCASCALIALERAGDLLEELERAIDALAPRASC